jgi:hypothetical protein
MSPHECRDLFRWASCLRCCSFLRHRARLHAADTSLTFAEHTDVSRELRRCEDGAKDRDRTVWMPIDQKRSVYRYRAGTPILEGSLKPFQHGRHRRGDPARGRVRRFKSACEGALYQIPARARREGRASPWLSHSSLRLTSVRSQFQQRASDNRFVANIRLVQPPSVNPGDNQDGRNQEPADEGVEIAHPVDKRLAAVPDALRAYASLIFLVDKVLLFWWFSRGMLMALLAQIGERPPRASAGPGTYVKETRLVRFINEVYDARYEDMSASCMSSCGSVRAEAWMENTM